MELWVVYDRDVVAGAGVCRMDCIRGGVGLEGVVVGVETLQACLEDVDGDLSDAGAPATVWRIVSVVLIGGRVGVFVDATGRSTSEENG
jgi:hypothetical protein